MIPGSRELVHRQPAVGPGGQRVGVKADATRDGVRARLHSPQHPLDGLIAIRLTVHHAL
jgi:hypothetical protein